MVNHHTFVICAYKESPYLEECIQSLLNQTYHSKIIIITSTPNSYIEDAVKKYGLDYYINEGQKGIVGDWNFAYKQAKTNLVTLAHQDDIYDKEFAQTVVHRMNEEKNSLISFTDYSEIRNDKIVEKNRMLTVKRIMLLPLTLHLFQKSKFIRRRILSFGSAICCPSVTFNKKNLPDTIFTEGYRSDEDWQAWERISRLKGSFIYCNKKLTYHRIHEDSETTSIIGDHVRSQEDYEMFCMFWPKFIAKGLVKLYSMSEQSNELRDNAK